MKKWQHKTGCINCAQVIQLHCIKLGCKFKHMYVKFFMHLVDASLNPNPNFKRLCASPKLTFLSFFGIFWQNVYCFRFLNPCWLTMVKSGYTIYTGVLYLHNASCSQNKGFVKIPPHCQTQRKRNIKLTGSPVIRRYMKYNDGVKGRYVTCGKSMKRYHARSHSAINHCQIAINFKSNMKAATFVYYQAKSHLHL